MTQEPDLRYGILGRFLHWEQETPDDVFLRQPAGNSWQEYSWHEVGLAARKILTVVRLLDLKPGDKVGLWSGNCAAWVMGDLGLMMGGFVSVPLYANANATAVGDILGHAECQLLFLGKLDHAHWQATRQAIPEGITVVSLPGFRFDGTMACDDYPDELALGATVRQPDPDDLLTLIYTSGTTGKPKGVMHSFATTMQAMAAGRNAVLLDERGHRFLSYLPLSHAAERGIVEFAAIWSGGSISFVESVDRFAWTMRSVRPTHFMSVPRVWQKFREGILGKMSQRKLDILLSIPVVAGLLRKRIRTSLGLQDARVIISGAAPINPELLRWFARLDIIIQEGYGLTEDFNVCSVNPRHDIRIGTTGTLFPGQELRVLTDTHEIIQRAPWIMTGYYKQPELTAEVLKDGYFHTGDTGTLVDGYLTITGRVKDIFKTAKGEYIAPYPIEERFLSMPEVEQACVLGAQHPQPFIVVILSNTGKGLPKEDIDRMLTDTVQAYNAHSMKYQQLRKIIILADEWTTENNMLTLTMKMKRNIVATTYEEKLGPVYTLDEPISRVGRIIP